MKNDLPIPRFSAAELTAFPRSPERQPVAFMFQPTHYRVVSTPKELELWEKTMREDVGPRAASPLLKNPKGKLGSSTLSYSCWHDETDLTDADEL